MTTVQAPVSQAPARWWRTAGGLATRRGALGLCLVALASYALQALAWPLERGRDSWDYWLWFLQLLDREPPFSALAVFRTPITPLLTGAPMAIGGGRLLEVVMALVYAATIVGWAWAVRPLGARVAVATGLVMLVNVPYAGLFHEVSSDFAFAALFALFAGLVVRALERPTRRRLVLLGLGVAALTLCRPTGQVALAACLLVPLVALPTWRGRAGAAGLAVLAAAVPLALWAIHNAVRYDDLTVARGGKAWVPFFKVAGRVDPASGDASRRLAEAVEREVLTQPPYAERGVDVGTYFHGAGNLEVVRMIALSDRVFGWDTDYQVLWDASLEAIRADPGWYLRDVADTVWAFLSQRYAPEPRERPVPIPDLPAELVVDGKPFPAPITVSPLVEAVRYGLVWCPTDDLERCVVPDPAAALGSESEGRRYTQLVSTIRDWNAQLPLRDSNASLASKAGTASVRWPRSFLWLAVAAVALAVRRPRGSAAVLVLGAVAGLILVVHALSQAPQSEFALPVQPVWIVAALVGLLGTPVRPGLAVTSRPRPLAAPGEPPTRADVIRSILAARGGTAYLELGVRDGACFEAVEAPTRVAVDPAFTFRIPWRAWVRTRLLRRRTGALFFRMTSDAFFAGPGRRLGPFSVVFVDGLHTAEQSHRDVANALGALEPDGAVVLHDCNPQTPAAGAPSLDRAVAVDGYDGTWNGDVFRTIVRLRTRADLRVVVLDTDQGLGLVLPGPAADRLDLTEAQVEALTYEDLARDRVRLLGLCPPDALGGLLAAPAA